jgi:TonB-linked SusC/RagA family outer membrane protein
MYRIYTRKVYWPDRRIPKILLIMKLTTVLLIGSFLHLSAAGIAQNITFSKKNVTLEDVLTQIRKQSGFNIVLSDRKVNLATKVDVNFNNTPVEEAIKSTLSGLPLSYKIDNNTIIIREQEKSLLDKVVKYFSAIDVRGRVVDENGNGLAGATVKIKGTNRSILTNKDGEFFLANVDEASVLVLSYVGYDVKEVPAVKELGDVALVLNSGKLEEVKINAGYYTVTDRERTGSIAKITSETIGRQPVNNPLMALAGNVPGVQIIQQSGNPGGDFVVQIRGRNSINSQVGNDPLYIIDGITYPSTAFSNASTTGLYSGKVNALSLINPVDIESIEILKDADATAIYGSRGANGVILISTKKGKQGNTKIIANISQGFSNVPKKMDFMNTQQYLDMRREALKNDGLSPGASDYDLNGKWDVNANTDWQKLLIGGNAATTNASLNVSGGTAHSNYVIGGDYYNEGTVYPGDFGFKRIGAHAAINLSSADDRFNISLTANYNYASSNLFASSITSLIQLAPNQPSPFDQNGQLNWSNNTVTYNNPMAYLLQTSDAQTDNLLGNTTLSYRILKNLIIRTSIGYNKIIRKEFQKLPLASQSPTYFDYTPNGRQSLFGNNYLNNFLAEPQINYTASLWEGKIDALIGMSFQNNSSQLGLISARGFTSDDLMNNIGSAATITNSNYQIAQYRYMAIFARLNYKVAEKYYLNITARRDGSSRFGPDKQFANFGAIGIGWVFSDESFVKDNLPFLSFGKLRGSYGITGNDQISDYQYLQLWNTSTAYQTTSGATLTPSNLGANADFAWETNRKLEGAVQLGFLKNRLNFEIAYYRNRSSNQLLNQSLPLSTGLSSVQRNLPALVQNTGLELSTDAKIINSKKIRWTSSLNLTVPKNKLVSYPGLASTVDAFSYVVGQPLNIIRSYNVTVDSQTGVYKVEDKNNSGTIDDADKYIPIFIGQKFYGGLQNSISYGQFTLDIQFSFAKQSGTSFLSSLISNQIPGRMALGGYSNQLVDVLGRWQEPGDETSIQKFTTISANSLLRSYASTSNLFIVDASYLRLRNLSLSWSLPKSCLSKLNIKDAILSFSSQNLFTFTNYIGLDPETQSNNLPPLRTFMAGLNLTF